MLKIIAICKDRFNGVTVDNDAPLCIRSARRREQRNLSNKTQTEPVIIYSKYNTFYSIMVMISYAALLIVSTSKIQKDALYSYIQFVWFVISVLRYLKKRLLPDWPSILMCLRIA